MNPGIGEEGVKVANSFIEALKQQPAVLALIVVVFVLLGFIYYQTVTYEASWRSSVEVILKQQAETQQLLLKCFQPQK